MKKNVIRAEKLMKVYKLPAEDIAAVNGVDMEVASGDFISLMGPSGSGKTTLLDVIGCLDSITGGSLTVLGKNVSNVGEKDLAAVRRGSIGFVFQEFLLIPELTAVENVELPMLFAGKTVSRARAKDLLEKVGLGHRIKHLPKEMSGGEQQRVAIARSLAADPELLLADEPTGNLDSKNSKEVFRIFEKLNEDGLTIVLTTHNEALGCRAKRTIWLKDGQIVS